MCLLLCLLDGSGDVLASRSRLRRDFLRVPACLLVHKPGVASPHEHVQVAKHHREVEAPEVGELCDSTGDVVSLTQAQCLADAIRVCGIFHILQAFSPSRRTHQPQEDQDGCQQEVKNGSKVRVFVDVHVTQIHQQSCHAVEETDNANAYEKLSSRGGVADQVRRCYRVVTNSGVRCNKWNLAQPEWVVKVGIESLISTISAEKSYDVHPWETTTASKSKYSCEPLHNFDETQRFLQRWQIESKSGHHD